MSRQDAIHYTNHQLLYISLWSAFSWRHIKYQLFKELNFCQYCGFDTRRNYFERLHNNWSDVKTTNIKKATCIQIDTQLLTHTNVSLLKPQYSMDASTSQTKNNIKGVVNVTHICVFKAKKNTPDFFFFFPSTPLLGLSGSPDNVERWWSFRPEYEFHFQNSTRSCPVYYINALNIYH